MTGSGGVSIKAGASPRLDGRRSRLRKEQRRQLRRRGDREPERSSAMGALLCGDCGQLGWPASEGGAHPLRGEASTALVRQPPCSHCGQTSWIDLGLPSVAMALREGEDARAQVRRRGLWPVLLAGAAGLLVGVWMGLQLWATWQALTVGCLCGLIGALGAYRGVQPVRALPPLPARWFMALPPSSEPAEVTRGEARATGDPLTAPLSGRRCVAFEVGVRYDDDASAPAGTWVLIEQRLSPLTVDGERVDPEQTHLQLPRQRLGSTGTLELPEAGRVFLRDRGLWEDGMALELFESVVEDGATVELLRVGDGAVVRVGR